MRDFGDEDMLRHEVRINGFDPDDMSRKPLIHATIYDLSFVVIAVAMIGLVVVNIIGYLVS